MAAILRSARNLARVLLLLLLRGAFGGFAVLHPLSAFVLPFRSAPQEGSALNPSCSPLALRKKAVTATVGTIFSASMDLQMSSPEESEAVRPALSSFEGTIQLTGIIARRKSVGKWLHFVTLEIPECELTAFNGVTAPVLQLPVIVKFEDMPLPNSLKKGNRISVECTDDPDSRAMQGRPLGQRCLATGACAGCSTACGSWCCGTNFGRGWAHDSHGRQWLERVPLPRMGTWAERHRKRMYGPKLPVQTRLSSRRRDGGGAAGPTGCRSAR